MKYLITWNIPAKPEAPRRTFYNRLKRLLKSRGLEGLAPKGSVILVDDRKVAKEILNLAKGVGEAWLYPIKDVRQLK